MHMHISRDLGQTRRAGLSSTIAAREIEDSRTLSGTVIRRSPHLSEGARVC
jgi:hypothetical protein